MIWFTSDLHFGHLAVIKYAKRPFTDVADMDAQLIQRWNARVKSGDTVYIIGDFSFYKINPTLDLLTRLNGHKWLVPGNHDKTLVRDWGKRVTVFGMLPELYTLKVPDEAAHGGRQRIVLCHYAMRVWNQSHRGAWQLYGHSHGSLPDDPHALSMDVGVDSNNYAPVSYDEVKAFMAKKNYQPIDHHGAER